MRGTEINGLNTALPYIRFIYESSNTRFEEIWQIYCLVVLSYHLQILTPSFGRSLMFKYQFLQVCNLTNQYHYQFLLKYQKPYFPSEIVMPIPRKYSSQLKFLLWKLWNGCFSWPMPLSSLPIMTISSTHTIQYHYLLPLRREKYSPTKIWREKNRRLLIICHYVKIKQNILIWMNDSVKNTKLLITYIHIYIEPL